MAKQLLFVFNIHSGKGAIKNKLAQLVDGFGQAGYEVVIRSTQGPGEASEQVEKFAPTVDAIVCAGGDGTVNETMTGIIKSGCEVPLLFIPCGSTNDYGASLKIPKDPLKALERLKEAKTVSVDIGRFNDRYFDYVAAFGLLTDISYTTDQKWKNRIGYGAYVVEVAKRLVNIPVLQMSFETDDGIALSGNWFYGMITNSRQVGGLKNITGPDVVMDDGLFEVTLVRATKNPVEFVEVLLAIQNGTHNRFIERFKTRELRITSEEPIAWTLDGEPGGSYTQVTIDNLQKAVQIFVP